MKVTQLIITVLTVTLISVYAGMSCAQEDTAQNPDGSENMTEKMFSLMHQNQYQERNIVRAKQMIKKSVTEDLPTEPMTNKAMEGIAKEVPEEQVIKAMERVQNRHRNAHRIAKKLSDEKKPTDDLAPTIADCLAAGMNLAEMEKLANQLQTRARQRTKNQDEEIQLQTMQTVRSMMRLGAGSTDTASIVEQALQNQYTARQMERLRHQFAKDAQFTSPKNLARQYSGSFGKGGNSRGRGSGGNDSGGGNSGGSGSGGSGSGGSGSGGSGSGGSGSGGSGSGGSGSGGSGSDGSGSGGSGSGGSGSGGSGSGGSGSGGSGSGGSGSGGSGSGGGGGSKG